MHNFLFLLVGLSIVYHAVSSPLPKGEEPTRDISDEVKELESLRTELQANVSDNDDHEAAHAEPLPTPLPNKEVPPTNSRSAIFRHRGITEAKKSQQFNENPYDDAYDAFELSPTDIAAYIMNTGDEKGVAVAVEELVREGMMDQADAVTLLQAVKHVVNYLRMKYEHEHRVNDHRTRMNLKPQIVQQGFPIPSREQFLSDINTDKRDPKTSSPPVVTTSPPHQEVIASEPKVPPQPPSSTTAQPLIEPLNEVKRRPHTFNSLALRVIYKLAKDTFTRSLIKDDFSAEETLSQMMEFLEFEERNQRISSAMKETILEVISSALVDSERAVHGYVQGNLPNINEEEVMYRHLSEPIGSKSRSEMHHNEGHGNMPHLASKVNRES